MSADFNSPDEQLPRDETDENLHAYLDTLKPEHLAKYDPDWSDEEVKEWDGNFRSDGPLMLVCCERDVEVEEFRKVVEERLREQKSRD